MTLAFGVHRCDMTLAFGIHRCDMTLAFGIHRCDMTLAFGECQRCSRECREVDTSWQLLIERYRSSQRYITSNVPSISLEYCFAACYCFGISRKTRRCFCLDIVLQRV